MPTSPSDFPRPQLQPVDLGQLCASCGRPVEETDAPGTFRSLSAERALLNRLVRSVAQATAELIHEQHGPAPRAWHERREIAEKVLRQTIGCALEDQDSEYLEVLVEMRGGRRG